MVDYGFWLSGKLDSPEIEMISYKEYMQRLQGEPVEKENQTDMAMEDEDYRKAMECCKMLDCENCPIKEIDYCQELLDFEKYKRENQH